MFDLVSFKNADFRSKLKFSGGAHSSSLMAVVAQCAATSLLHVSDQPLLFFQDRLNSRKVARKNSLYSSESST